MSDQCAFMQDPYAGFRGALMCLEERGDIAFVKHSTVEENRGGHWNLLDKNKDKMQNLAAEIAIQGLTTETEKMQCCRKLFLAYRDILNHGTTC
jgi:hypothetical protein